MSLIPFGFWAASGGGAAGAYDLLETTTLATSASSVTFTGLGSYSDYAHLQVRLTATLNLSTQIQIRFNSDSGSNYSWHYLQGSNGSVSSFGAGSQTQIAFNNLGTSDHQSSSILDILDFSASNKNTTTRALSSGKAGSNPTVALYGGGWFNTNAVTSFELIGNTRIFDSGSRFSLYGIKGA